jgi:hypothetical protein
MSRLMKQSPAVFHGSRPSFHGCVSTLATIGVAMLACLPCSALAQRSESKESSPNAAVYYRQAVESINQLPDSDRARIQSVVQLQFSYQFSPGSSWGEHELVRFSDDVPTDERAKELVARLERALRLFRQGADSPRCDWGWVYKGEAETQSPNLTMVPKLVGSAIFRARYHWVVGKQREAVEDLQALKRYAPHVGSGGKTGLVDVVMQYNVERVVVFTVSQWLVDSETAKVLEGVAGEPSRQAGNLAKNGLLVETETVLPWAHRLIDGSKLTPDQLRQRDKTYYIPGAITVGQLIDRFTEKGLLKQIEQSHRQYQKAGRLLDLPVAEFQPRYDEYVRHIKDTGNIFSTIGVVQCPGIVRAYYDARELRVRWTMLEAAVAIHLSGPKAMGQHTDPFSDGPFGYRSSDDGFVLSSRLIVNGTPVTMRFTTHQRAP